MHPCGYNTRPVGTGGFCKASCFAGSGCGGCVLHSRRNAYFSAHIGKASLVAYGAAPPTARRVGLGLGTVPFSRAPTRTPVWHWPS